jgi:hypothetical protein
LLIVVFAVFLFNPFESDHTIRHHGGRSTEAQQQREAGSARRGRGWQGALYIGLWKKVMYGQRKQWTNCMYS